MNLPTFSATDLLQLQRQLRTWRQSQSARPHLPEALWEAASRLAQSEGVSRVSRALHLDYYRLQRRARAAAPTQVSPTGFVELPRALPPPGATTGVVELVAGPNRRLLLHTGTNPTAWVALAEAFWRAHS